MHAVLLMKGPRINNSAVMTEPVDNVNLYPMFCSLLKITCAPNNGTMAAVQQLLTRDS